MKVAFYNQLFGMRGTNIPASIIAHTATYLAPTATIPEALSHIKPTLELIKQEQPEIIGIAEVLEHQHELFTQELRTLGYRSIHFSQPNNAPLSETNICIILATRKETKLVSNTGPFTEDFFGGGCGFVHARTSKTHIIAAHLALAQHEHLHRKQLRYLGNYIQNLKEPVILIGDFNNTTQNIRPYFPSFSFSQYKQPTFPTALLLKPFKKNTIDHIATRGFTIRKTGQRKGNSDHYFIMAEVRNKKT